MRWVVLILCLLLLGGCAARPPAPVEERSNREARGNPPAGWYRVSSGDTLYAIAFRQRLDYLQLARWNGLKSPYVIYPGQDLRLTPPPTGGGSSGAAARKTPSLVKSKPAAKAVPPEKPAVSAAGGSAAAGEGNTAPARPTAAGSTTPAPARGAWLWPVEGRVLRGFLPGDPERNGIVIAGREGDPVRASAPGTVVYSGNGLIGYGELIIVKHDDQWLSAYGHNRKRLVAEGDAVGAGQKIAELGRNDRNEQVLHFEIRSNGKPVNPLDRLPAR